MGKPRSATRGSRAMRPPCQERDLINSKSSPGVVQRDYERGRGKPRGSGGGNWAGWAKSRGEKVF